MVGVLGGIGIFLLGMTVMTDGLKELAGASLRRSLSVFTRNPLTGAVTGMVSTAIIQSSSAVTVMAVGFVGAGLLTFPETIGIIFGANIGTTITGWLVALLGFKLSLKEIVLPLILLGALMRLFGRGRWAAAGFALAGFGLVFAGIATLQSGMEAFRDVVTPDRFPPDTVPGRALLVLIGIVITLVTQSSSAGIATAITAVHVGNISVVQAAAMAIGMDVGTTVTAALAAIGGNVNARRTGIAHVIYNLLTGVGAFLLLPFFFKFWEQYASDAMRSDPEIAVVAFHTTFNTLGVVLALPFTYQFASLICRIVPAEETEHTRRLERSLLEQPHLAVATVIKTLNELTCDGFRVLGTALVDKHSADDFVLDSIAPIESSTCITRDYLNSIDAVASDIPLSERKAATVHIIDHLQRFLVRSRRGDRLRTVTENPQLHRIGQQLGQLLVDQASNGEGQRWDPAGLESLWTHVDEIVGEQRRAIIEKASVGHASTEEAIQLLDALRWLRRLTYHAWRMVHHLQNANQPVVSGGVGYEPDPETLD